MKRIEWNAEKNAWLLRERGICFEQVVEIIEAGTALKIIQHPNQVKYPHQKMFILEVGGYIWMVPFVETDASYYLKTVIPTRKLTKKYRGKGES